jgi:hypothetical protein
MQTESPFDVSLNLFLTKLQEVREAGKPGMAPDNLLLSEMYEGTDRKQMCV